ncbi:MAG: hypothetical protein JO167_07660 [Alphaproteobacteria bacterium]|nr:hypothetical protein [Alphaproteobacteria bacterium]MBV9903775.1 hypothetical protein [Alphaproteobacteria bacterium]
MTRFEALAEEAMSAVFDARGVDVRAALEDALYNIERALDIARIRGWEVDVERLTKRKARIQASFDVRFKKKKPTTL